MMVATLGEHYNVGEKPAVILYTYTNRHAEPPSITKQETLSYIVKEVVIIYDRMGVDEGNLQVIEDVDAIDTGKLSNNYCYT